MDLWISVIVLVVIWLLFPSNINIQTEQLESLNKDYSDL